MLSFDYLPQKGVMTSDMFIPPAEELPELWISKFIPFNFPGIPAWGNAQLSANVMKPFLLTAVNMSFRTTAQIGGQTVASVVAATPGAHQLTGAYYVEGVGGGGSGALIFVVVDGLGAVTDVVLWHPGFGYVAAPTFSLADQAGGAPPATFTVTMTTPPPLSQYTGKPSVQIYQNHRKVQLQLLQKTLFAPNLFGGGGNPGYLKTPYLFAPNDQITVECNYTSTFPGFPGASNTNPDYLYCFLTMIGGSPL